MFFSPPAVSRRTGSWRKVMGIHDETIHAGAKEMIHGIGDDRTSSDLQEGLRTPLGQGAKPRPQAGAQDEGGLESPSFQFNSLLFSFATEVTESAEI